jgi:CRP-like cAMP-binding protein
MASSQSAPATSRNRLLARLSPQSLERLPLQDVDLPVNFVLYEPNQPIQYSYFPDEGVLSVVSLMENGSIIEVGTIGREGMACAVVLLETNSVPYRCFVQVEGKGRRVAAGRLKEAAEVDSELRRVILRYEADFRTQTMQGMACNGLHSIEQRCCRWILMTRDRTNSDDLKLSHEFLALMLGVRRSSVTEVLGPLQAAGLVSSHRGTLSVVDRRGLEARVCECYKIMAQHEREM